MFSTDFERVNFEKEKDFPRPDNFVNQFLHHVIFIGKVNSKKSVNDSWNEKKRKKKKRKTNQEGNENRSPVSKFRMREEGREKRKPRQSFDK